MNQPVDLIGLIADAVAQRLAEQHPRALESFKLVGRQEACRLLDCSPDYFREQIEPRVRLVPLPSAGGKREFKRWDVEDLKGFVVGLKREAGEAPTSAARLSARPSAGAPTRNLLQSVERSK